MPNIDASRQEPYGLRRVPNQPAPQSKPYFMNPLNKIKWRNAIIARKTKLTLDGRDFTLNYKRLPGKVLIKPAKGYTPMAWLDVNRVEQEAGEWIVE